MTKKQFMLCLAVISAPAFSQSQQTELLGVSFTNNLVKNKEIKGNNKEIEAFLNFPVYKDENDIAGVRINYIHSSFEDISPEFDKDFNGIDTNWFWQRKIDDRHKFQMSAKIGVYSDFEDFSVKDFRYRIGANYSIKHSENLNTGWGLAYSRQFTGHQINPFFSIDYKINNRWEISGLLPIKPKITYKINNKIKWINELSGEVESFRLSEEGSQNAIIENSGWYGMSSLDILLEKHHQLNFGIGYSLKQKMRLYQDTDTNNWKIFTFNLSEKNKPTSEIVTSGFRWQIGYSYKF